MKASQGRGQSSQCVHADGRIGKEFSNSLLDEAVLQPAGPGPQTPQFASAQDVLCGSSVKRPHDGGGWGCDFCPLSEELETLLSFLAH